jgi:hypothetical protein
MLRRHVVGLCCLVALVAAGCGGGEVGGGAASPGAEFAPASVPAFVEINTDVDGDQWLKADALLDKFPGRQQLADSFFESLEELSWEQDVRPALGDALHIVWLDLQSEGDNFVGFTKPQDAAKFNALLECCDDPQAHRQIDGWTVFAETDALIDRFEQARSSGSLADEDAFTDAMGELPEESIAKAYVSGAEVSRALREQLRSGGAPGQLAELGELEALAGGIAVEDDGVRVAGLVRSGTDLELDPYEANLSVVLPAGALLYVSFGQLEDGLKRALESAGAGTPGFQLQLGQLERALGLSLDDDLFPLFQNEGAIAVYEGTPTPTVSLVLEVDDEDKAREVLSRLGALAELGDAGTERTFDVDGLDATELDLAEEDISLFHAVVEGELIVSTTEEGLRAVLGDGDKLEADPVFTQARDAAELPNETVGFVYANLRDGLPYAFGFAGAEGEPVPPEVTENTRPLQSALLYSEQDGENVLLSGFLTIE